MKKVKSLLLIALFSVFSFAFVGIVKAEDVASGSLFLRNGGPNAPRMVDMVCEPDTLTENGAKARCYLIGALKSGGDGLTEVNGFAVQVYTTQYLRIEGAYINDGIGAAQAGSFMMDDSTVNTTTNAPSDAPESVKNYRCNRGDTINIAGQPVTPLDYKCALFYTKKTQTSAAYNLSSLVKGHRVETNLSQASGSAGIALVGSFEVKLETDKDNVQECGEICYMLWEVPTAADYDNSSCSDPEHQDEQKCKSTKKEYSCKEITVSIKKPTVIPPENPEDPTTPPPTGAFTSYAVLAAGALIAIGAIAMAKKNNKFNKI